MLQRFFSIILFCNIFISLIISFALPLAIPLVSQAQVDQPNTLLTKPRQLTFVGTKSGEGYFDATGTQMVFQSDREEGNPFYQIYLMDLLLGKSHRVSPGVGKTTCAYINPRNSHRIIFSSTHLDPDANKKAQAEIQSQKDASKDSSAKKKYSWSYDENYDIFEADGGERSIGKLSGKLSGKLANKKFKRLTKELGYDAEGSYSPDGKHIVFASNREAYAHKMSPEDQKTFDMDQSSMMDIYVMNSDGSNVKQLTTEKGYDGGPFYSSDGKMITWRRFSPDGRIAEIMVMNADGTKQRAVTRLGAMSWAPYFHPSNDYLIFATNLQGYSNFELYIVDTFGEKPPLRVTFEDGFDGLPVFTPDGSKLSWTKRDAKGNSQIYIAEWDDLQARKLLGLKSPILSLGLNLAGDGGGVNPSISQIKNNVRYLASEDLKGRLAGSEEEKIYTQKIADLFKELKLQPAQDKNFINEFEFTSGVTLGETNVLKLQNQNSESVFKVSEDFVPLSFSRSGTTQAAPVVFAGYGIVAPATEKLSAYDSYRGLNVKGKWVLAFRSIPEDISPEQRVHLNLYSKAQFKATVAKNAGAIGLILVSGPNSQVKVQLTKLQYDGSSADTTLSVISVTDSVAEKILGSSSEQKSLKDLQLALDKGEQIDGFEIPNVKVATDLMINYQKSVGRNVVGLLKVPGATKTLVIGAHGDHLGFGQAGTSLATGNEVGKIHFGADDNASGVAGVLALARILSQENSRSQGEHIRKNIRENNSENRGRLKQNILFAVWSAEEIGLLGSSHFVKQSNFVKQSKSNFSAYLNMDMIGRLQDKLSILGVNSSPGWMPLVEMINTQTPLSLTTQGDPLQPTDATAFYLSGVPAISFFTGAHGDYHKPSDTAEKLNYQGIAEILRVVEGFATSIATETITVPYQKSEGDEKGRKGSRQMRVYLGTIPDYSQEGVAGVRISGTSPGSPAEKGGLVAGDIIFEFEGRKIENLYDYVYSLQAAKPGKETNLKVKRKDESLALTVVPTAKE